MKISAQIRRLELIHPFGIARGVKTHVGCVFVTLEHEGISGLGEASPNARYGETSENVLEAIARVASGWPEAGFTDYASVDSYLAHAFGGKLQSGRAALDMAWWDWLGKRLHTNLAALWNAPQSTGPVSSFTIGLDSEEIILQKLEEARDFPVLKIKLGSENDDAILALLKQKTSKILRIDANEGWKDLETAKNRIRLLNGMNVEFIEQPMPAHAVSDMQALKSWSPLPLIADESLSGSIDLDLIASQFHGINIKLMKCGGPGPALKLLAQARKRGLSILVGCMIESSLANTAGALVSLWADFADLDGFKLIKNDPYSGLQWKTDGTVTVPASPGLGVKEAF